MTMDNRTHVVALSGGKDSTAMALGLMEFEPGDYLFVCTPTGDELPEMLAHWARLEELLGQEIIRLTDRTLDEEIERFQMLPNHLARWCTRRIKIEPFKAFMQEHAPAVSYVGLRADELGREGASYGGEVNVLTNGEELPEVEHRYPLVEWGWALDEVWAYLNRKGVSIPQRTDCARCFFQRIAEWYLLWRDNHDYFLAAERQEGRIGHTYRAPKRDKSTKEHVYEDRYGIGPYVVAARDTWPAALHDLRRAFEAGHEPTLSLRRLEREGGCRVCSL